jgi:hypothetical protein
VEIEGYHKAFVYISGLEYLNGVFVIYAGISDCYAIKFEFTEETIDDLLCFQKHMMQKHTMPKHMIIKKYTVL